MDKNKFARRVLIGLLVVACLAIVAAVAAEAGVGLGLLVLIACFVSAFVEYLSAD
jgi:hypothetical protein